MPGGCSLAIPGLWNPAGRVRLLDERARLPSSPAPPEVGVVDEVPDPSAQLFNARTLQAGDRGSPLEVVPPVLFNTYKHHAGALRVRIGRVVRGGADPPGLGMTEAVRKPCVAGAVHREQSPNGV